MSGAPDAELRPPAALAFVGLGHMGAPMAGHLAAAGWTVRVFDRSAAALDAFAAAGSGAVRAASPAEAGAGAAAAITMLPDGAAVREAVLGPGGLAEGLPRGALVVDMSSSAPLATRRLGEELAARGLGLVDAPVSGGVKRARDRTLAIMAGGDPALVTRCKPLLAAMGSAVHETGALGTGHAMKALNNFVSAAGLQATCEALIVGGRFGLDPGKMVDILNASTGRNNSTEAKARQFILSGSFASGFSLALMAKDLRTAAALAEQLDVAAPTARAVSQLWDRAREALDPDADHTEIHRYLALLAGGA